MRPLIGSADKSLPIMQRGYVEHDRLKVLNTKFRCL